MIPISPLDTYIGIKGFRGFIGFIDDSNDSFGSNGSTVTDRVELMDSFIFR